MSEIISTMGPGNFMVNDIINAGICGTRIFRLNLGKRDRDNIQYINNYAVAKDILYTKNINIQIMLDIPTARPRIVNIINKDKIKVNDKILLSSKSISSRYAVIVLSDLCGCIESIAKGDIISIENRKVEIKVLEIDYVQGIIHGECVKSLGVLSISGALGINKKINFQILTKMEQNFLKSIAKQSLNIDYFALSFACRYEDVVCLEKELLQMGFMNPQILSKIETYEGISNVRKILQKSQGLIIARGDLALNVNVNKLYIIEKELITAARNNNKICIVATQLLEKYVLTSRIGYSEVNDIMFAIKNKVDYLMLCGESSGQMHPFESIKILKCLIDYSKKFYG